MILILPAEADADESDRSNGGRAGGRKGGRAGVRAVGSASGREGGRRSGGKAGGREDERVKAGRLDRVVKSADKVGRRTLRAVHRRERRRRRCVPAQRSMT